MSDRALATTLGDREGLLAPKIEELLPGVVGRFGVMAVRANAGTHPRDLSLLREAGAPCVLHGDFFPDNVLSTGKRSVALDPETYRGDPAFDAGTFAYGHGRGAHMEFLAEAMAREQPEPEAFQRRTGIWAAIVGATNLCFRVGSGRASPSEIEATTSMIRRVTSAP